MSNKFSKGYYAMKEKIEPVFLVALHHNNHMEDDFVFNTCKGILKKRINERGELGGDSFTNLCKLECEYIIKLLQLDYASSDELRVIQNRMSELEYLIENIQSFVSNEFRAKSRIIETGLKREREKEERQNILNDDNHKQLHREIVLTMFSVFACMLFIPVIIHFFK